MCCQVPVSSSDPGWRTGRCGLAGASGGGGAGSGDSRWRSGCGQSQGRLDRPTRAGRRDLPDLFCSSGLGVATLVLCPFSASLTHQDSTTEWARTTDCPTLDRRKVAATENCIAHVAAVSAVLGDGWRDRVVACVLAEKAVTDGSERRSTGPTPSSTAESARPER